MHYTEDGHWRVAEATDPPVGFYDPPAQCLRCGVNVSAVDSRARELHDSFHARIGDQAQDHIVKVCSEAGCPAIQSEPRCRTHTRERDQARGTRQQRGYGPEHVAERARWAPLVATGTVGCWRCHKVIPAGTPWDLGHHDTDRTRYLGPEHQACNRATAGRHGIPRRLQ